MLAEVSHSHKGCLPVTPPLYLVISGGGPVVVQDRGIYLKNTPGKIQCGCGNRGKRSRATFLEHICTLEPEGNVLT